jgi:hypothetical protein
MYFQLEKEQDKMNLDLMIPLFLSKILMDNYNHYPYQYKFHLNDTLIHNEMNKFFAFHIYNFDKFWLNLHVSIVDIENLCNLFRLLIELIDYIFEKFLLFHMFDELYEEFVPMKKCFFSYFNKSFSDKVRLKIIFL